MATEQTEPQIALGDHIEYGEPPQRDHWLLLSAVLLFVAGIFNFIIGVVALNDTEWFADAHVGSGTHLVFGTLTQWGWVLLIIGVVEMAAAFTAYFSASGTVAMVAVVVAGIDLVIQFLFLGEYPIWSAIVIAVNLVVIYGLARFRTGTGASSA